MDWLTERRRRWPDLHVYHYAPYEVTALKRLMGKYATREKEMDDLLRTGAFVDLYRVVHQGFVIGTPSYSLKDDRAPLHAASGPGRCCRPADRWWSTSGGSTAGSRGPAAESLDPERDPGVQPGGLRVHLDAPELAARAAARERDRVPARSAPRRHAADSPIPPATLRRRSPGGWWSGAGPGRRRSRRRARLDQLVGWLVEFHRREEKPMWWRMFDRHEMTVEERFDDRDCLAGLIRTERPTWKIARSQGFEYRYDTAQETRRHAGDKCFVAGKELPCRDRGDGRGRGHGGAQVHQPAARPALPHPGRACRCQGDQGGDRPLRRGLGAGRGGVTGGGRPSPPAAAQDRGARRRRAGGRRRRSRWSGSSRSRPGCSRARSAFRVRRARERPTRPRR